MAKYNAAWGEPRKMMVDLPVMFAHPLNWMFPGAGMAIGGVARLAPAVGKTVWTSARLAAVGTKAAPIFRAASLRAGAEATAALASKDAAQKYIASFLATKTLAARVSQTAITSSKGAAAFGVFTLADKALADSGTNNINNHPGLQDEFDAFLEGAEMGALLFGAFSTFAQTTGFTNTVAMKVPALKAWAQTGGRKWLDHNLKMMVDSTNVRKIRQEGKTLGEATESVANEQMSLKDSLIENDGILS